jgi:hypothetical protein
VSKKKVTGFGLGVGRGSVVESLPGMPEAQRSPALKTKKEWILAASSRVPQMNTVHLLVKQGQSPSPMPRFPLFLSPAVLSQIWHFHFASVIGRKCLLVWFVTLTTEEFNFPSPVASPLHVFPT